MSIIVAVGDDETWLNVTFYGTPSIACMCTCWQDVECIVFDGQYIVSSCLAGEIRVWDSTSGECVTSIDRRL